MQVDRSFTKARCGRPLSFRSIEQISRCIFARVVCALNSFCLIRIIDQRFHPVRGAIFIALENRTPLHSFRSAMSVRSLAVADFWMIRLLPENDMALLKECQTVTLIGYKHLTPMECNVRMIRLVLTTTICLCFSQATFSQVVDTTKPGKIMPPEKYTAWGDIEFSDETAHLDKIADQLKEWKLSIVYLVIYAGQTACKGEAAARGGRAKTYLLKQGVDPWRVEWI